MARAAREGHAMTSRDATDPAQATLQVERVEHVLTLRLDRPARLNAIDEPTARALLDALAGAEHDAAVRVVVLRGNGRAFCAGRDIGEAPNPEILEVVQAVARAIVTLSKPVVAAVHGWVVGAGVEWMLDADIVVAARSTRLRLPEIGIGVFVTGGVTRTLPSCAGLARAKGLLLLGEEFSAADAERWGLVWSVVDDDRLDTETARIAARLAGLDPGLLGRFKRVLNTLALADFEAAIGLESRMQTELEQLPPPAAP
jgi:2-(1,2-epoxy-1,2-dihydrophenyl)acetyl-CoA isomerase